MVGTNMNIYIKDPNTYVNNNEPSDAQLLSVQQVTEENVSRLVLAPSSNDKEEVNNAGKTS